jgi:MoaA/NifB/PqqE/SkfB family radical SAM enzyme
MPTEMTAPDSLDLFGIQWHVTDLCEGRCRHCYQDVFTASADLPFSTLERIADALFTALPHRAVRVTVTGGEPLLWPPLFRFLTMLAERPGCTGLDLVSSGLGADHALMEDLAGIEKLQTVKLSIEAADPTINDAVRGRGHQARFKEILPRWQAAFGDRLVLMMTLGRHNLDQIEPTALWAADAGCGGLIIERFVPLGRGRVMAEAALNEEDWRAATRRIAASAKIEEEALLGHRAFWLRFSGGTPEVATADCQLGRDSMAILPDGTVLPCRRLPPPVGKLPKDDLLEILDRLDAVASKMKCSQAECRAVECALRE